MPASFSQLAKLEEFYVTKNQLRGGWVGDSGGLPRSLTKLYVDENPDLSSLPEPLPPDRVCEIKQVMAGLNLAPPPPTWAAAVPESVWIGQLLRRAPDDPATRERRRKAAAARQQATANGGSARGEAGGNGGAASGTEPPSLS